MASSILPAGARVLVTGANGFVGQVVCRHLAQNSLIVRAAVRSSTSGPESTSWADRAIVGDLSDDTDWSAALQSVDAVLHLAARVHVMKDRSTDPLAAFRRANVDATVRLARAAAAAGVRRFVFVSSIKVNGEETTAKPFSEADVPAPVDNYGVSKWEAEEALKRVSSSTGMEVVIVRPPLVYGPNVRGNFLLMLHCLYKEFPLPLGSARNLRSLVGVDNLSSALVASLLRVEAANQTFLVSDNFNMSTAELLSRTAAALDRKIRLVPFPLSWLRGFAQICGQSAAVQRLCSSLVVDSSHIRNRLGWDPPLSVEDGLASTAAWYRGLKQGRSL